MKDKNGMEIMAGDFVRIDGGYFKADNGTYLVETEPEEGSDRYDNCHLKKMETDADYFERAMQRVLQRTASPS